MIMHKISPQTISIFSTRDALLLFLCQLFHEHKLDKDRAHNDDHARSANNVEGFKMQYLEHMAKKPISSAKSQILTLISDFDIDIDSFIVHKIWNFVFHQYHNTARTLFSLPHSPPPFFLRSRPGWVHLFYFIYFISRKNITKTWQMTITNE